MKAATLVPLDLLAPDLTCPALLNGACSVYSVRPLICRLWGVVRAMACPWGCEPERWLTDAEAAVLFSEIRAISDNMPAAGPRTLKRLRRRRRGTGT